MNIPIIILACILCGAYGFILGRKKPIRTFVFPSVCTGCGHLSTDPIPESYLSCCPDHKYIPLREYVDNSKFYERRGGFKVLDFKNAMDKKEYIADVYMKSILSRSTVVTDDFITISRIELEEDLRNLTFMGVDLAEQDEE